MQGRDAPVLAAKMPLLYPDTASSVQLRSSTSNVPAATIPHAHKALSLALGRRRLRFEKHQHGLLLAGRKTQEDMFLVELPRKTQVAATLSLARDRLDVKATVRRRERRSTSFVSFRLRASWCTGSQKLTAC